MRKIIVLLLLSGLLCMTACHSQIPHTDPPAVETGDQNVAVQDTGDSEEAGNTEDNMNVPQDTTEPDMTQPETTEPEETESGESDWQTPQIDPEPTEPETTAPAPTEPDTTGSETVGQTTEEPTEDSYTEPDTTPIDDGQPNTDTGWGPIV